MQHIRLATVLRHATSIAALAVILMSCSTNEQSINPIDDGRQRLGGPMTVNNTSADAFGLPAPFLNANEQGTFSVGNAFFRTNWVTAPATTTSRDGLGPTFHAASCTGCHFKDGRGAPPEPGEIATGLLIRLSTASGTQPDPVYGYQLATRSILGVPVEGHVVIDNEIVPGNYADGSGYQLRKPLYSFTNLGFGPLSAHTEFSARLAPQLIGLGLLESVDASYLENIAIEQNNSNNGVSGRVHYVTDELTGATVVGRFGWKARQPSVKSQSAHAFSGDMGLTTSLVPSDDLTAAQLTTLGNIPNGGTPEITNDILDAVTFYTQMLSVPMSNATDRTIATTGKQLFTNVGCASCHRTEMKTGSQAVHPRLANVVFHPYTDMLLHDMGDGLADNRSDGEANGREWRTPPLWGIGKIVVVNKKRRLLHDGRAHTIEEAILWHGGEAHASQQLFIRLSKAERALLIAFVESL